MLFKLAVLCRGHRRQKKGVRRSGALTANDTLSVAWPRGSFWRDAGPSSAGFLYHMDWLKHVYTKVGPSGVPPSVHERSHEDARLPHAPVPWQVVGPLQRLFHESIPSMRMLSH